MRIDTFHTGAAGEEIVALDQIWRQGPYAGSRTHLVDDLDLGRYLAKLYDAASGEVIWSRGFDSYFGEWLTTGPAAEGVRRTYHESVLAPLPLAPVVFALEARQKDGDHEGGLPRRHRPGRLHDPPRSPRRRPRRGRRRRALATPTRASTSRSSARATPRRRRPSSAPTWRASPPSCSATSRTRRYAGHINVRGVLKPSQESGCDEPSRGVHRNTALGCTFDSLGSERYLLTEDNRAIRDVAAAVPYDVLYIMVNHERYGGGGIYNLFCTFTSDNQWSDYVFLHEFGHAFAGLADEYYSSSTAYNDFYPARRRAARAQHHRPARPGGT